MASPSPIYISYDDEESITDIVRLTAPPEQDFTTVADTRFNYFDNFGKQHGYSIITKRSVTANADETHIIKSFLPATAPVSLLLSPREASHPMPQLEMRLPTRVYD